MNLGTKKSVVETSFDEALDDFKEFLLSQKISTDLIWIFSEDVIFQNEHIYIKAPISNKNEALAKDCYELVISSLFLVMKKSSRFICADN